MEKEDKKQEIEVETIDADDVHELIKQNKLIIEENRVILKKMHRFAMISFWIHILWFIIIIGLPVYVYFYFLQPIFTTFEALYESFMGGLGGLGGF